MLRLLRRQWFLLGLAAVLGAAIAAPEIGRSGGPLVPELWQGGLVAAIFLLSGLDLRTSELRRALPQFRLHLFVQGVSLVVCPLLFYGAARGLAVASLPERLLEGFVVLGCLPTTVTSGVAFTRASGGDEAGALFNATLGNLLGIVVSPLTILLATGRHGSVPASAVVVPLAWQVLVPVAIGQSWQWLKPRRSGEGQLAAGGRPWFGRASMVLLLALVYLVFCNSLARGFDVGAHHVAAAVVIASALHGALFAIAFRLSMLDIWRFSPSQQTAAVIGSTQKTAALGLPLLAILYRDEPSIGIVALPLLVYHPLQLLVAGAATGAWRRYNGANAPPDPTAPESDVR
jgi:solute carrier family 10 (sodium/bile acid cotransporter), member 7